MGNSGMESRKLNIIEYLTQLNDESLLLQIENLIQSDHDFWKDFSEDDKEKIRKGIQQHEEGDRIEFDKFIKNLKKIEGESLKIWGGYKNESLTAESKFSSLNRKS